MKPMFRKLFVASLIFYFSNDAIASGFTYLSQVSNSFHIAEHVLTLIFVSLIFLGLGLIYRTIASSTENRIVPDKGITFRNIVDVYGDFIYKQCVNVIGEKDGPKYFSFIAALFLFILLNNLIGLIPGFLPPTENLNTTLALGVVTFAYYNIQGCREQGVVNYLKHFMGPLWYMAILIFPIEIISNAVRPFSLAFRLRGNLFGDHLVLGIFSGLMPYVVPVIFLMLGLLVCFIQAFVFSVLTMVYISLAVAHQDHGEASEHH